jgi:hypothetical protein
LKTYLPDGDIDLTTSRSASSDENFVHEIHDILLSEEQSTDSEFEVKDVQLINAEVLSLPYCYFFLHYLQFEV